MNKKIIVFSVVLLCFSTSLVRSDVGSDISQWFDSIGDQISQSFSDFLAVIP